MRRALFWEYVFVYCTKMTCDDVRWPQKEKQVHASVGEGCGGTVRVGNVIYPHSRGWYGRCKTTLQHSKSRRRSCTKRTTQRGETVVPCPFRHKI